MEGEGAVKEKIFFSSSPPYLNWTESLFTKINLRADYIDSPCHGFTRLDDLISIKEAQDTNVCGLFFTSFTTQKNICLPGWPVLNYTLQGNNHNIAAWLDTQNKLYLFSLRKFLFPAGFVSDHPQPLSLGLFVWCLSFLHPYVRLL